MFDPAQQPSIEAILRDFAVSGELPRHPALSRRFASARTRLLAYLATDAQHVLLPQEQVLLAAERQFRPEAALARVFGAEVLVATVPGFLAAGWLPRQVHDARVQIRFVELLCDWVVAHGLLDGDESACLLRGVRAAARRARSTVRNRRPPRPAQPSRAEGAGGRVGS